MIVLDFAPATVSIITQFFLPIQNPRIDCSAIRNWTKVLAVFGHAGGSEIQWDHLFPSGISEAKPFGCISVSIVSVRKDAGNRLSVSNGAPHFGSISAVV